MFDQIDRIPLPPHYKADDPEADGITAAMCQSIAADIREASRSTRVATFDDGSQVLVTIESDGTMLVARREWQMATWGRPVEGVAR